jgi:hypothetical protein
LYRWLVAIDLLVALVITVIMVTRFDSAASADSLGLGRMAGWVVLTIATFLTAVIETSILLLGSAAILFGITWCVVSANRRRRH